MGAQNHKPTSTQITAASAWLSQKFGEGYIRVLEANNRVEDAIILGMDRLWVEDLVRDLKGTPLDHLKDAAALCGRSIETVTEIEAAYDRVLEVARKEGYQGNPLASELPKYCLQQSFRGELVLPSERNDVWASLTSRISDSNILSTLEWEKEQFAILREPTLKLVETLEQCRRIAETDGAMAFVAAVENNKVPVRQYGAQVLSSWNYLSSMFLYSALIMTELYYRTNGFPSLMNFEPSQANERIA